MLRFDRCDVPDAIATRNNGVIAIEAETQGRVASAPRSKSFDTTVVIAPPYNKFSYSRTMFEAAIKMRSDGPSYPEIQRAFAKHFGKKPALATLHYWCKGQMRPLGLRSNP